ncbi:MAG: tetratricopeptide repeat protein [Oceanospirillaceae bacterium]|nr:tetratricopeptide repeat protein [Oceanospirillaceae bacterium]MCP5350658.1 tetratricopeptide repeat protein [Oceanospirillaceae bacterium]
MLLRIFTSFCLLPLVLAGCSSVQNKPAEHINAQVGANIEVPSAAVQPFQLALNQISEGKLDEAEKNLLNLTTEFPQLSGPYANLGIIYAQKGDLKKAEEMLKTAINKNPQNADAWNELGVVYRADGQFKDSKAAYEQALKINPNLASAYFNLGILLDLYLGDIYGAADNYRKFQALTGGQNTSVAGWLVDIDRRLKAEGRQVASDGAQQ